jgi:hypothetical protein
MITDSVFNLPGEEQRESVKSHVCQFLLLMKKQNPGTSQALTTSTSPTSTAFNFSITDPELDTHEGEMLMVLRQAG